MSKKKKVKTNTIVKNLFINMSGAIFKGVAGDSQCSSKNVQRIKKKHSLAKTYGVL